MAQHTVKIIGGKSGQRCRVYPRFVLASSKNPDQVTFRAINGRFKIEFMFGTPFNTKDFELDDGGTNTLCVEQGSQVEIYPYRVTSLQGKCTSTNGIAFGGTDPEIIIED